MPEVQQAVIAHVRAWRGRFRDALEGRMTRWHGVSAQFLEHRQTWRDDDAVVSAARNMTVGVVFPRTDEKHASRIQEYRPGPDVPFECARIRKDKLVLRRVPAGRGVVARGAEIFHAAQPA